MLRCYLFAEKKGIDMKPMIWLNGIAGAMFLLFAIGGGIVHWVIVPQLGYLHPPPAQVGIAIEQTLDLEALREVASTLFEHITVQTMRFNLMIRNGVFWVIVHFMLAFLLAVANLVLIRRHSRQPAPRAGR